MHGGGHPKVPSFMHQATFLMASCPRFFSFRPTSPRFSHFPRFHLTTSHRHHFPTRTMQWLVACTRTLPVSSSVPHVISGFACSCLFCFWVISLPTCLLSAVFGILTTCAHHAGCRVSVSDHAIGFFAHRVVSDVGEAFRAAF